MCGSSAVAAEAAVAASVVLLAILSTEEEGAVLVPARNKSGERWNANRFTEDDALRTTKLLEFGIDARNVYPITSFDKNIYAKK